VSSPHRLRLVRLSTETMRALVAGDLASAAQSAGVPLTSFFADHRWLWEIRLQQAAEDPSTLDWIARAALDEDSGDVVGHVGFHGPPDDRGMVEVAYSVDEAFRRRGYATAMLTTALAWAADVPEVRVVRASISPDNQASLGTIRPFGFQLVGEQWDEEDGRELLFERPVR
jgi:[ribosomal protein S5]-alanine N-acetyltransferase